MGNKSSKKSRDSTKKDPKKSTAFKQNDKIFFGTNGEQELANAARIYNVPFQLALDLRQKYMMFYIKPKRINLENFSVLFREFVKPNATESEILRAFDHYKSDKKDGMTFGDLMRAIFTQWTIHYSEETEKRQSNIQFPPVYSSLPVLPLNKIPSAVEKYVELPKSYSYDTFPQRPITDEVLKITERTPKRRITYIEPRKSFSRRRPKSTVRYRKRKSEVRKVTILIPKDPSKPIIKWIKNVDPDEYSILDS